MSELKETEKKEILEALATRQVKKNCPMCGYDTFGIFDGYLSHPVQYNTTQLSLGGEVLPTAVIICKRCGFVSQHALGTLGLLPEKEATDAPAA